MRYVDKIMLEKPYPVLCSTKDLSLYLQLGTAVFQYDEDAAGFSCRVNHSPIVVPVNIRELVDDVYCSVNSNENFVPLCMQGDDLPVTALNLSLRSVSCGPYEECLDISSLSEYFRRENLDITITVPKDREINLVLTFGSPCSGGNHFWHTLLLNEDSLPVPVYLWSTAGSTDDIVIDLVRRALAYAEIFMHSDFHFIPRFSFSAQPAADENIKNHVKKINRLFQYAYIYNLDKKCNFPVDRLLSSKIYKFLKERLVESESTTIVLQDLSDDYFISQKFSPELVHDFLEAVVYFKIFFPTQEKDIYFGLVPQGSGDRYDVVKKPLDQLKQLMKENREFYESPLKKYILE